MQVLLTQHRDPNLRSYWIWGPYLRNDAEQTARNAARTYAAPSSVHFWTPAPKLAQELAGVLRFPAGRLAWEVYLLYGRDTMWDDEFPKPLFWQHQLEILQGEKLDINVLDGRIMQALRK
jgi:hypothetical protein